MKENWLSHEGSNDTIYSDIILGRFFDVKIIPVLFCVCIGENRERNTWLKKKLKKEHLNLVCHKAVTVCTMSNHVVHV